MPVAWKTASNEAVKFDPRSRIRNLMSSNRSSRAEGEVAGLLHRPVAGRVRGDAAQVHPAGAVLDEHQDVQSSSAARCPRAGSRRRGSRRPGRAGTAARSGPTRRGAGSMPAACRISHTVDGATVTPSFVSSPWIRRYPHSGFSFASRTTRRAMLRDCRRPAGLAPPARVVLARGQLAVPGQQRRGRDGEDLGPAPAGYEPCQRGEPGPVGWLVPHPADVAAQHRVLVPEYQQFSILRQVLRNTRTARPSIRRVSR